MSESIQPYSNLLVISDTGIYQEKEDFYAFGPVVKELEELAFFERIVWIGFNRPDQKDNRSYIKINDGRIKIKTLKRAGGKGLVEKISILIQYPQYFKIIYKEILNADFIHVRGPSNPSVIAIFLSFFYPKKKFWFKYAGDWQGKTSVSYNLQRNWLKKLGNNCKVTVNGKWLNQSKNILAFENPCLDEIDRLNGREIVAKKTFDTQINYCFIGGLDENKGCFRLLQAMIQMKTPSNFGTLHIVGNGHLMSQLQQLAIQMNFTIVFHGNLPREEVAKIYEICHYIVLPSRNEGFPKVIGEAMNYGCVPIVPNISAIGQYVFNTKNGILMNNVKPHTITDAIEESLKISPMSFGVIIQNNYKLAARFTYAYYNKRILNEVFNKHPHSHQ